MEEKQGPRAFTIADLTARGFGSRSFLYDQIAAGHLTAKKCGRRTLIMAEALHEYWKGLPDATPAGRARGRGDKA